MRIAIIPARGGSVRVPRKNIRDFRGKPMLVYPIEAAKASGLFDLIVVSTDDAEIAAVAFANGATVVPREADDGTNGTQEIATLVLVALRIKTGLACVIYATSPLLTRNDLIRGLEAVSLEQKSFAMSVGPDGKDAGCFYWGTVEAFRLRLPLEDHAIAVEMPAERCIDINTPSDWIKAETMYDALRRAS